jgi:hypothetical protein
MELDMSISLRIDWKFLFITTALVGSAAACTAEEGGGDEPDLTTDEGVSEARVPFPRETFETLDHGIYWFGTDGAYRKAAAGEPNPHFDPKKPTVIYVHGWQRGTTLALFREAWNYRESGSPDLYLADIWRDAGWNVGIMYWNQFADEPRVEHAEAKIWSTLGPRKMRWMNAEGVYSDGPGKSAGQLFYESYRSAMAGYQGDNVRIVGHSLGNQMAIAVTKLISDGIAANELPAGLLPKRVALLDPVYVSGGRDYLDGAWTGERSREYVRELSGKGVLFEAYRSSTLSSNLFGLVDSNVELMRQVALTDLWPSYFGVTALAERHAAAIWSYFWSLSFAPPTIQDDARRGLSASLPDSEVRAWMDSRERLVHRVGTDTRTPGDDVMTLSSK